MIQEVGFRPNMTARQLAGQSSTTMGLVTFATSFYGPAQILANCEQASKEMGLSFMFSGIVDQSTPEIRRAVNELCATKFAGFCFTCLCASICGICKTSAANVPIVAVDSHLGCKCPAIYINQELGITYRDATSDPTRTYENRLSARAALLASRGTAFQRWPRELKAAGLKPGPVITGNWTAESGFEATQKLVTRTLGGIFSVGGGK